MTKAPDAFRTISEVAEILEVPQHVLRFWETRFSQIRPMKRAGGRRYYRPQDVDLLRGIRRLLYDDGYTVKGVQKILREHGIAHVIAIGRGELAVMPAGGTALLAQSLPAAAQQQADSQSQAAARQSQPAPQQAASAGSKVTALKQIRNSSLDAATLRRELGAALRELEEARGLLLQVLGDEAQDAGKDNADAAPRRGNAV